jgi:HEPN domain-containing protein
MPRADTQKWLDKALNDERAFQLLKANCQWDTATYHAQQAAEKFLKAALVEQGIIPRRTHDLKEVLLDHPAYVSNQMLAIS